MSSVVFDDKAFLQQHGLNPWTILDYFLNPLNPLRPPPVPSPASFSASSASSFAGGGRSASISCNEILMEQGIRDYREQREHLKKMKGVQYQVEEIWEERSIVDGLVSSLGGGGATAAAGTAAAPAPGGAGAAKAGAAAGDEKAKKKAVAGMSGTPPRADKGAAHGNATSSKGGGASSTTSAQPAAAAAAAAGNNPTNQPSLTSTPATVIPPELIITIRYGVRKSPEEFRLLSSYYIVRGVIYKCPKVSAVLYKSVALVSEFVSGVIEGGPVTMNSEAPKSVSGRASMRRWNARVKEGSTHVVKRPRSRGGEERGEERGEGGKGEEEKEKEEEEERDWDIVGEEGGEEVEQAERAILGRRVVVDALSRIVMAAESLVAAKKRRAVL